MMQVLINLLYIFYSISLLFYFFLTKNDPNKEEQNIYTKYKYFFFKNYDYLVHEGFKNTLQCMMAQKKKVVVILNVLPIQGGARVQLMASQQSPLCSRLLLSCCCCYCGVSLLAALCTVVVCSVLMESVQSSSSNSHWSDNQTANSLLLV